MRRAACGGAHAWRVDVQRAGVRQGLGLWSQFAEAFSFAPARRRTSRRFAVTGATRPAFLALRILLCLLVVGVALTACKTLPPAVPPGPGAPWEVRRAALQARTTFDLTGRIGVAAAQDGFNAKLRWQQQGKQSQLSLDGPLGVGGVRIASNGESLTVTNSRGEQLDSAAARREIETRLGFEPPIASLRYWVLGVPDPSHPAKETLDDTQRLSALEQDGWQIAYTGYADVKGEALPSKMTLTRDTTRVRLVVDSWGS
jgi:outer membrane lipoprotein LolB